MMASVGAAMAAILLSPSLYTYLTRSVLLHCNFQLVSVLLAPLLTSLRTAAIAFYTVLHYSREATGYLLNNTSISLQSSRKSISQRQQNIHGVFWPQMKQTWWASCFITAVQVRVLSQSRRSEHQCPLPGHSWSSCPGTTRCMALAWAYCDYSLDQSWGIGHDNLPKPCHSLLCRCGS